MRNLSRISNYYNRLEAVANYARLRARLNEAHLGHLLPALQDGWGWRVIDKHARDVMSEAVTMHECDHEGCPHHETRETHFTVKDILDSGGVINCDFCGHPLKVKQTA